MLAQTEARLHALQQLQRHIDSDKNLNAWLQQHQLDTLPRLWQSIRIENGWEDALEAVLRERLNALAMPLDTAAAWSDAPPAKLAVFAPSGNGQVHNSAAQLKPLLDYVQCQDAQVLPAMRDWLAHIYAIADVAQGNAQRAHLPAGGWFVTPQGHLIGAHSMLFHAPDSQLHGVLARQREIEKLDIELAEQNRNAEYSRVQVAQAEQNYQSIEIQIVPLRTAGNDLQQRLHGMQMNILKLNQAHERSVERAAQIEREMQEAAELLTAEQNQQRGIDEQMAGVREQIAAFYAQVDEAQRQASAQDLAVREQRSRAQHAQHALQEARFCQDLRRKSLICNTTSSRSPMRWRSWEPDAVARRPVGQRG